MVLVLVLNLLRLGSAAAERARARTANAEIREKNMLNKRRKECQKKECCALKIENNISNATSKNEKTTPVSGDLLRTRRLCLWQEMKKEREEDGFFVATTPLYIRTGCLGGISAAVTVVTVPIY